MKLAKMGLLGNGEREKKGGLAHLVELSPSAI
jgi:hypothetical protein